MLFGRDSTATYIRSYRNAEQYRSNGPDHLRKLVWSILLLYISFTSTDYSSPEKYPSYIALRLTFSTPRLMISFITSLIYSSSL